MYLVLAVLAGVSLMASVIAATPGQSPVRRLVTFIFLSTGIAFMIWGSP